MLIELLKTATEEDANGCWIWQRAQVNGYGTVGAKELAQRPLAAHVLAWRLLRGEIPPGMVLHHDCRVRLCCNPDHLRLLTRSEHSRLHGEEWKHAECSRGHDPEHTYRDRLGHFVCRACRRERNYAWRARKKSAA